MIAIVNVSKPGTPFNADHEYELRINSRVIKRFKHRRSDGLSKCLERAASAAMLYEFGLMIEEDK